ncbi:MAG: Mur ligase family protein [Saprospiraceae bacterium]
MNEAKRIHLIAIGGAAMHNLALALHDNGNIVSGSDDQIYEPSLSRLNAKGLLPVEMGWFPEKISPAIDIIILGMHAKIDNPELLRALELDIPVMSYPEYVALASKNKKRVVVAGSHGKTTTTSIIMHILRENNMDFDYLVGSIIDGFDNMVRLSEAPLIIIEGDEYLSSALDLRPKIAHYQSDISIITGIAWDHINVFPTFDEYLKVFENYINSHNEDAKIYYCEEDIHLNNFAQNHTNMLPYHGFDKDRNGNIMLNGEAYKFPMIGEHNLKNAQAAFLVCQELGVSQIEFFQALSTFTGAKKRLQLMNDNGKVKIFLDFAHSPSKLKATVDAVKSWFPDKELIAFFELHTYSSLQENFLVHYKSSLDKADRAYVLYNEDTLKIKNRKAPDAEKIILGFGNDTIKIINNKIAFEEEYEDAIKGENRVVLLMSSGDLFGVKI